MQVSYWAFTAAFQPQGSLEDPRGWEHSSGASPLGPNPGTATSYVTSGYSVLCARLPHMPHGDNLLHGCYEKERKFVYAKCRDQCLAM